MAYGTLKCDNIVFDNGGTDKLVTVSGLFFSTSGALTVTGTISGGNVTAPTATFTTLTGTTTAGTTATFTSGSFTSLTGVSTTVTSGIFSAGSATAPSVAVGTGTTYKPGIYSPGADQLAISTSGTGRIIVDASGNVNIDSNTLYVDAANNRVGIGTTSPGFALATKGDIALGKAGNASTELRFDGSIAGEGIGASASIQGTYTNYGTSSAGALVFKTNIGSVTDPSEKARIDSSGRLLVGTSSARSNFYLGADNITPFNQVETTTNSYSNGISLLNYSLSGYPPTLNFGISQTNTTGTNVLVGTTDLGIINFTGNDGTNFRTAATIRATTDGTAGSGDMPGRLVFSTTADGAASPTERMTINSNGNVGIGGTPSAWYTGNGFKAIDLTLNSAFVGSNNGAIVSANWYLNGSVLEKYKNTGYYALKYVLAADTGAHIWQTAPSGTAGNTISFTQAMTLDASGRLLVGVIASPAYQLQVSTDSAGKPSSALWTIVSDERIKEDIELADLDLCYEAIKAIPLKRYKWRDDIYTAEQVTDRRKLGWIAQDVEAIFPKAVGTHEFKYNQVFEETIIPAVEEELDADGNVITPAQPERIEQGDLISEDVIEDCRDLNSDQLYAAMYGAVQKLMAKVETLEASNTELLARLTALEAA